MTTNNFKPILFSTEMVQAILAGRKTQTRRTQGLEQINANPDEWEFVKRTADKFHFRKRNNPETTWMCYPKFLEGDILWVRETFDKITWEILYKADDNSAHEFYSAIKWKPSIHMPKEADRIFLKVTNVRVERLQDINAADSVAEGISDVKFNYHKSINPRVIEMTAQIMAFRDLWDSINAKKNPWDSNPWVWVYEFERIEKPENFLP